MIPLCFIGEFNPHAVIKAVDWWNDQGIPFVIAGPDSIPSVSCIAVILEPNIDNLGLRGLTVINYVQWPIVAIAKPGDALAIGHELGHVLYGAEHDVRPHHILSTPKPAWRL